MFASRHSLLWPLLVAVIGCGSELALLDCPVGASGCVCTPNGGCDAGLVCDESVCRPPAGTSAPVPNPEPGSDDPATGGDGGTGSDGDGSVDEEVDPPRVSACGNDLGTRPAGNYYVEPLIGDWPDCVDGCAHRYSQRPLDVHVLEDGRVRVGTRSYDGLQGVIDGELHAPGNRADLDKIRIYAPAGTLLEVRVEPFLNGSCLDPIVASFDPVLGGAPLYGTLTQNDDASAELAGSRTLIAASSDRWYLDIFEAQNVLYDAPVAGGEGFEYLVLFENLGPVPVRPLEFDPVSQGAVLTGGLPDAGDIHYFSFRDPDQRPHVIRFETDNPAFCGHVWQVDPESFSWLSQGDTGGFDPLSPCPSRLEFTTNPLFAGDDGETYLFLVTDALGRGSNSGAGEFAYSLTVSSAF